MIAKVDALRESTPTIPAHPAGRLDHLSGSFIDEIWNSMQDLVRPIFRR